MLDILENLEASERESITELLKKSGSGNVDEAVAAQKLIAAELTTPLRQGILTGDITTGIFNVTTFDPNAQIKYPIDLYRPDNAGDFVAYTLPSHGKIPERHVEGDYVTVPVFDIGSSIDFLLQYAKEARWDIVSRALEVMEAGVTKKINDDAWHTLLTAGFDRNILVNDSNASTGQFTKRLVSLMKLTMRRNAGGNSTSMNRGKLTHLYLSPEAMEDIRNWGVEEVDEVTRREIYTAEDGGFSKIFGVTLVDLDELGDGQEYQDYYESVPAVNASNDGMASGDVELVVGLDLSKRDAFVMPVREQLQVFEDPTLHRSRRQGYYCWMSYGVACLTNSRILLGSL